MFHAGVPLGIIPRGTANAFSVALGIPTHIDDPQNFAVQAADVILQVRTGGCEAQHCAVTVSAVLGPQRHSCRQLHSAAAAAVPP